MNETPNTRTPELFDAMVATYETWAGASLGSSSSGRSQKNIGKSRRLRARHRCGNGCFGTSGSCPRGKGYRYRSFVRYGRSVNPASGSLSGMQGARDGRPSSHVRGQHFRRRLFRPVDHLVSRLGAGLDEAVRVVRPGGWLGIVHWANPEGADIFIILSRALKKLPLPTGSPDAPKLTALTSVHELRAALEDRKCEVMEVERLDAPSPLPTQSFMDTLDPIYRSFPTYRSLDEHLRGELRVLLAQEARRWVEQDVPAGRTAKVHLALARCSGRRL
jgi:hypothetical protein